ncbi:MAG: type IV secretory system conjugative DNA transfer family protein [Candidatus Saccharimonadales bacterium]
MPTDFPTPEQMDAFIHAIVTFVSALPRIALALTMIVAGVVVTWLLILLVLRLVNARRLLGQKTVLLELTPHAFTDKTPLANQKLFSELHGLEQIRSLGDKLLRQEVVFTLELVGTREEGIRYIACVPERGRRDFEQDVASYSPEIKVRRVEEYLLDGEKLHTAQFLEFRQTRDFAYPLQINESFIENDPVAYLMGAMTQLQAGEMMVIQLVLSPVRVRSTDKIARRVLHNEEQLDNIGKRHTSIGTSLLTGINSMLFAVVDGISDAAHGSPHRTTQARSGSNHQEQVAKRILPARTLGPIEQPLAKLVYDKLSQDHFRTNIRALVIANDRRSGIERTNSIRKAVGVFDSPKYQKLRARPGFPGWIRRPYRRFMFTHRLPGLLNKHRCLLAASELGGIYHFPHSQTARTEGVIKSLSRTLPVPPIIKKRADAGDFDVMLGVNEHLGASTAVGLTAKEREKHLYLIGGTGNGKTTMLQYAIVQDIRNGKGVAVIDPHGDLAKTVLKYIPEERIKDVVYLNPADLKHPIGINLLELPDGLDEDELLREKGRVTSAVISIMRKVFSDDDSNAHRIEAVMRNAIHTALTVEGATLFTVMKLLRNAKFRKEVVSKLDDEDLKDFWQEEIGQAGEMQLVSMTKGVTQRIDRFNISAPAKRMLGQVKSTINFEDIMNSGKILICNFAHGEIDEDESALFGTTILAKLKMAAERRASMPEDERRPFYLYVDEFQNFATTPFVKMLSSSRKYKLFLTIAEQSTKQQEEDRLTEAILSNVSTVVCFRTGSHADEELMLHTLEPYIVKGEISNLPTYNFYIRIQAEESLDAISGKTIVLPRDEANEDRAVEVIKASQDAYAITYVSQAEPQSKGSDKKQSQDKKQSDGKSKKDRGGSNKNISDTDPLAANEDA